jgi:hypothetical protein
VCCLRMTALRPVIVLRSSVQKPATSARRDSARASIAQPVQQQPPKQPFRRDRRPAIPGIKFGKCPRPLSKRRIHKLTTHSQRMICWIESPNGILLGKPFRAIILPQHRIPHQKRIRGLLLQALGDRCAHCRVLRTLPAFGHSIARRSLDEVPTS